MMASGAKTLCATCQCKTVEFVVAFAGPSSCRAADVCRYDEPGYPWKIYCDKYQSQRNLALVPAEKFVARTNTNTRGAHAN
jgi:hypothetical protein